MHTHSLYIIPFYGHSVGGTPHHLLLKLPVMINKFCEPTTMTSQDFFKRWKQLSGCVLVLGIVQDGGFEWGREKVAV